jgi:hypothetical protein
MIAEKTLILAPPNGLLYLTDAERFDPPEVDELRVVWRSESCIIIGCQPDTEGPTEIRINPPDAPPPDMVQVGSFDQAVPSRRLVLTTVLDDVLHEMTLERPAAHVEIWTDGEVASPVVWLKIAERVAGRAE